MNQHDNQPPSDDALRPHSFDGIQEYDKRLPNWWLLTFYGAIVFAVVYWMADQHFPTSTPQSRLAAEMARIEAAKLASVSSLDDATLWKMSRNAAFVEEGKQIFNTNCATCHMTSLRGKDENPAAIGVNLVDNDWIYGGKPTDLLNTITKGTPKGMPTWGPVLGTNKITRVIAYIESHHEAPAGTP